MNYVFQYAKKYLIISFLIIIILINFRIFLPIPFIIMYVYFLFYFFRRPEIKIKNDRDHVYSPATGKVLKIIDMGDMYQIAIFINLWDEHIQYVPYSGYKTDELYKRGKFNPAYVFAKGKDNERLIHYFNTEKGAITVIQIAGVLARSIVSFKKPNEYVKQCEELGLIKFGSRCDIFIPKNTGADKLLIKEGQHVNGGITKIYRFSN